MKKVAAAVISVLAVALVATPLASSSASAASAKPNAKTRAVTTAPLSYDARLLSCRRSPSTDQRFAVVGASMRPVPGGKRLAMRVELFQKPLSGGRWMLRGDVPGLGTWMPPSDPSIGTRPNDVFKYRQSVGRLVVPYAYRFRVSFRWSDAAGRVVREESAVTVPCREPDLRPDLVVASATVEPDLDPTRALYIVVVKNVGRSVASSIGVGATFASSTRYVRRLGPAESGEVTFIGPACPAGATGPTFLVDPGNTIDEGLETNNSLLATCPAEP
ncbi:CARDB domain-containing protein [Conexibacter woesei]|uniref:CARDB domain-containing protein n=1 Tax=Conexibacter woesei (strain DSM 14684 / CCUG 47730 / CIP 108061 / JCM 11494 / NBRC 100937 / ID131577) TaxID=469383 RepID=D3F955_CONWI|nr:CARDB domain-containing protein [Conexibacter woesei]ADB53050.1 hypothetical protein Cwoe_4637 [Conexibacter woesei DSM 14684]